MQEKSKIKFEEVNEKKKSEPQAKKVVPKKDKGAVDRKKHSSKTESKVKAEGKEKK